MLPAGVRTTEAAARVSAATHIHVTPGRLANWIRNGKIKPPVKDSAGVYWWSEDDIAAAVAALSTDRRRRERRTPQFVMREVQCVAQ